MAVLHELNPYVALLRAVNVGGRNRLPMAELRALCGNLGWERVRSYIQSGNLAFLADGPPKELEHRLEAAIEDTFGHRPPAIVRSAADWERYASTNPFPDVSMAEPKRVTLTLSKAEPKADAIARLRERAAENERIDRVDDAIWIHYGDGIGRSKLTTTVIDRLVGSTVTTRNWRTVLELRSVLHEIQDGPDDET